MDMKLKYWLKGNLKKIKQFILDLGKITIAYLISVKIRKITFCSPCDEEAASALIFIGHVGDAIIFSRIIKNCSTIPERIRIFTNQEAVFCNLLKGTRIKIIQIPEVMSKQTQILSRYKNSEIIICSFAPSVRNGLLFRLFIKDKTKFKILDNNSSNCSKIILNYFGVKTFQNNFKGKLIYDLTLKCDPIDMKVAVKQPPELKVYNPNKEFKIGVFTGASDKRRSLSFDRWLEVLSRISSESKGIKIVFFGMAQEVPLVDALIKRIRSQSIFSAINECGKTTDFRDLIKGVKDCDLIIGPESAGIHLASFLNVKSICILGGGHFGLFMPYSAPFLEAPPVSIVSEDDACFRCNWNCNQKQSNGQFSCIGSIALTEVQKAIKEYVKIAD